MDNGHQPVGSKGAPPGEDAITWLIGASQVALAVGTSLALLIGA